MSKRPTFADAKARYIHRYTMEHVPAWAARRVPAWDTTPTPFYAPQYRSDAEGYANTTFPGEPGHLGGRRHCYSSGQTWPLGQWLDKPYQSKVSS